MLWQWCFLFLGSCAVLFVVLLAFYMGVKAGRGDAITIRQKPLPKPQYNDPHANNALKAARRKAASEKNVHFTEMP